MPIETKRLKLPLPLGNESVSRVGINAIFEKIDEGVATRENLEELRQVVNEINIPDASLTQEGIVQLSNDTGSDSETEAATSKAVNDARAEAISAAATDATTKANTAQTAAQTALNSHANTNVASGEAHGMRVRSGKLEYYDGSNWLAASSGLDLTTTNINYYVDAVSGNDNNTGLSAAQAFKTINKALSLIPSIFNNAISIIVAAGTYAEDIFITDKFGSGSLSVTGPTSGSSPAIISGRVQISRSDLSVVYFSYFTIANQTTLPALTVNYVRFLRTLVCTINVASSTSGISISSSKVLIFGFTISNRGTAISCGLLSQVLSQSNTGSGNTVGLFAFDGSTLIKAGVQPSATTAESTSVGGLIRS